MQHGIDSLTLSSFVDDEVRLQGPWIEQPGANRGCDIPMNKKRRLKDTGSSYKWTLSEWEVIAKAHEAIGCDSKSAVSALACALGVDRADIQSAIALLNEDGRESTTSSSSQPNPRKSVKQPKEAATRAEFVPGNHAGACTVENGCTCAMRSAPCKGVRMR